MDHAFQATIFDVAQDASQIASAGGGSQGYRKKQSCTIDKIPEKCLLKVFSFLHQRDLGKVARVCKKWRLLAYDHRLWQVISLRPEHNGLHVNCLENLLALINVRFGNTLRYIELPCELVTSPVLHELSNKCVGLRYMTLDFSNAMQLHDFNDLNAFPCNLRSLCICLSEVIFLEGFMRRIYSCLSSLQVLHLIGTFEQTSEGEEDCYEVINIGKIKAYTPNLKIVNMYGITFIDDSHIELLTSNCIHLECLALNYCLRVKGTSFKTLIQRCKKLKTLLLQHTDCPILPLNIELLTSNCIHLECLALNYCLQVKGTSFKTLIQRCKKLKILLLQHTGIENEHMVAVPWETSMVHELDLTSTELSTECLENVLLRIPFFTFLSVGHCEFFTDKILSDMCARGKFKQLRALDISSTPALSENAIYNFIQIHGRNLVGLMLAGKPKLTENFWLNVIHFLKNIRVCVLGTANGWFLKLTTKVHIDQVIEGFAQNCTYLERLEIQWDPDTIRFSDKSNKFVDHIRLKCPFLKSLTLSDGEYYEMVKSNFERADRMKVVRTTTNYSTSIISLVGCYNDLLFN